MIASTRSGGRRPRAPAVGARATAAATIHAELRDELVSLARRPGEAIVEKEIAAAYGVSRTPVREAGAKGDQQAFHRADEAFHAAIAEAAGHPRIWGLVQQVKVQVDRFRQLTLPQKGRMALVIREHAAVAAAIRRHDPQAAAKRMGVHLERLLGDIVDIRHLNPQFFVDDEQAARPAA